MKHYVTLVLISLGFMASFVVELSSDEVSIQVKKAVMRSKPSFLGKKIGTLVYATRLEVLKEKGAWFQVKNSEDQLGWIHKSSTTEDKITYVAGSKTTTVSDKEQAIAGKGYNEQVEKEYRRTKNLNYKWVDNMQNTWNATETDIEKFIAEGQLTLSEEEEAN